MNSTENAISNRRLGLAKRNPALGARWDTPTGYPSLRLLHRQSAVDLYRTSAVEYLLRS